MVDKFLFESENIKWDVFVRKDTILDVWKSGASVEILEHTWKEHKDDILASYRQVKRDSNT